MKDYNLKLIISLILLLLGYFVFYLALVNPFLYAYTVSSVQTGFRVRYTYNPQYENYTLGIDYPPMSLAIYGIIWSSFFTFISYFKSNKGLPVICGLMGFGIHILIIFDVIAGFPGVGFYIYLLALLILFRRVS